MKRFNTMDPTNRPAVVMLVYGEGGVGKTTFAATAPKPLLADCEGGAKYFGLRGISMDVAFIEKWADMKEYLAALKDGGYETAVIDPIGELMSGKLKRHMVAMGDRKLVQPDGSPSMAGWGWLKQTLRDYIRLLKDQGINVLLIAHVEEKEDEGRMIKRPMIETKISRDIVNMVDVVGYMTVIQDEEGNSKRAIYVDPTSDRYVVKDRTGQLGKIIEPDFSKIVKACQGTEKYAWSNPDAKVVSQAKDSEAQQEGKKQPDTKEITDEEVAAIDIGSPASAAAEQSEGAKKMRKSAEAKLKNQKQAVTA